ncbi:MAG: hypothetical protein SFY32_17040 [Bacteroidota bacterium]|nr:hypothetical protein [Bacteroidota bacterium]
MLITLIATNPKDVSALKLFVSSHPEVKEINSTFAHQYNDAGDFKEIDMHLKGPSVSKEYLDWYFELCDSDKDESNDVALEDFKKQMSSIAIQLKNQDTK